MTMSDAGRKAALHEIRRALKERGWGVAVDDLLVMVTGGLGSGTEKRRAFNGLSQLDGALLLAEYAFPGVWWIVAKGRTTSAEPLFGAQLYAGQEEIAIAEHDAAGVAVLLAVVAGLLRPPRAGSALQ
jgi:hypothetical protein